MKSMADRSTIQPPLPPIVRKSLESGLITKAAVGESRMPESACLESVNFHFDAIGAATVRKGLTALGSGLNAQIYGMHYFVDTVAGTNTQMIVVSGTVVYYLAGGSYISIRSGLTAAKTRFSTYLNFIFMVNGNEATAVWDGSTTGSFVTTGNASGAPVGKFIENFKSRMWILGNSTYPSRLFYSSVPSSVVTPVVTWNTSVTTGQWIDISPSDGDNATGLQRFKNTLLVFKTNRIYRVFDIGQVDPDPYYAVGTSSQESIIEAPNGVYFHHSTGFYLYNVYGLVQKISLPIRSITDAIPSSSYTSVTGWIEPDGNHVCWSVGNVTVAGQTYSNLVLRFTISTQTWTQYSYPTQFVASLRRQPLYTDGTTQFAIVGDTSGNVFETETGKTDNGTQISYSLIHRWDDIDGLLSTRKNIMTGLFSHYGGTGTKVTYQTDGDEPSDLNHWKQVGTFKDSNTGFNTLNIKARKLRFHLDGQSSGEPFQYLGYELIGVTNEFLQFSQ